jgi:hypothetical protein
MGARCSSSIRFALSGYLSYLYPGAEWKDDWGLALNSIGSTARKSMKIDAARDSRHDSVGDSNITRPLSVVRGATSDPFQDVMNSIQDLERHDPGDQINSSSKSKVDFDAIYPEDEDEQLTFSHNHSRVPSTTRPGVNDEEKRRRTPSGGTKLYSRKSRFQVL